jgi:hypothetical protein
VVEWAAVGLVVVWDEVCVVETVEAVVKLKVAVELVVLEEA